MGIKRFERIYYVLNSEEIDDGEWAQTLQPRTRISYDEALQSLAIQHSDGFLDLECDESDFNRLLSGKWGFWSVPKAMTVSEVIDLLGENEYITFLPLSDIDEGTEDGEYQSNRSARTFLADEDITLDDVYLIAYEIADEDAWKRSQPDTEYFWSDDAGLFISEEDAEALDVPADSVACGAPEYDVIEPITYAVIAKQPWSHDEFALIAATFTEEQAKIISKQYEGSVVKRVKR